MAKEIGKWGKPSTAAPSRKVANDALTVVTPLLEPGEQLIWHANGRGPHWTPYNIFNVIFVLGVLLVCAYGAVTSALVGELQPVMYVYIAFVIAGVATGFGVGIAHAVYSPSHDAYGLTDRRVITVDRFMRHRERSFDAANIKVLRIRDGTAGDITFWTQSGRSVNRAWAIVGVDNPRQIAELIKTTLKLELPVIDVAKPRQEIYIPPLKPRRPD